MGVKCEEFVFESSTGDAISRYAWIPERAAGDARSVRGAVFLFHGFRAHAKFNFLRNIPPDQYYVYSGSVVESLNNAGFAVFAHDHIGHGRSSGLRAYVSSFDALVQSSLDAVRESLRAHASSLPDNVPRFVLGHSLGGSVAIAACLREPTLFQGAIFSSPAVEPPANMLGMKGQLLASISGILSYLIPEWIVLELPPNALFPELHEMFVNDELTTAVGLRARVGHEFLQLYAYIAANAGTLSTPFLITDGREDGLVNPEGIVRFHDKAASEDKTVRIVDNMWHNLLIEPGCENIIKMYSEWITERCPTSSGEGK